jgi:hypothetical protein
LLIGDSTSQLEELQQQLLKDEEAFRRMKEATGDDDINKVIQKFLVQSDYFQVHISSFFYFC